MSLFHRRSSVVPATAQLPPAAPVDLAQALEIVLVKSVQSQADTASKIGQLITDNVKALAEMQQSAFKRASRQRGGRIRAGSAKRQGGRFTRGCRLCENPMIADPRREEIIAHTNHTTTLHYREENGAILVDVPADEVQVDAQGNQVIECADCSAGRPHQHGQH
jgi:hypothetical protein